VLLGWIAWSKTGVASVEVEFLDGQKVIGSCVVEQESAERRPGGSAFVTTFAFPVPEASVWSPKTVFVTCRFAKTGADLWGSPILMPRAVHFAGEIQWSNIGMIEGWAADIDRPMRKVCVVAYESGHVRGVGWTGTGRSPISCRIGSGDFAFVIQLDGGIQTELPRRLSVFVANTDLELDGSPMIIPEHRPAPKALRRPFSFITD
jgi:hypothetical protein